MLVATFSLSTNAQPSLPPLPYRVELQAAQEARSHHDDSTARTHYLRALVLMHGHPDVVYELARIDARLHRFDAAMDRLRSLAAMGLVYPIDTDSALDGLRARPGFQQLVESTDANKAMVGSARVAFSLGDTNLLAEDIAFDPGRHSFLISSVHESKIVSVSQRGFVHDLIQLPHDGFGVQALAVDSVRHALWATVTALPQTVGYRTRDAGRSALLRFDLRTNLLERRYDMPRDGRQHDLGDMSVGPNGTVVVSDGADGGVYMVPPGTDSLETLVAPGIFRSPQTPALLTDGRVLIADYSLGLAVIDPSTRQPTWLRHADTVALNGIDGMVLAGWDLYAVQNGVSPERVVHFALAGNFNRVVGWSVIERGAPWLGEPTHAVIVGRTLYFIANSGWDRFGSDGAIEHAAAKAPTIARVRLP